jgi:hypothetical protein
MKALQPVAAGDRSPLSAEPHAILPRLDGPAPNDRRYLSAFTKSKIWSVSSVSAVLIE